MTEKPVDSLLKPGSALGSYLDDILHQATVVEDTQIADIDNQLLPESLLLDDKTVHIPDIETVMEASPQPSKLVVVEAESETAVESEIEATTQVNRVWIADRFPLECLMFRIADNLLSIPLTEMNGVIKWPDNLTRLPNEPDWILGLMQHREQKLRVIDGAKLLDIKIRSEHSPDHILVLDNQSWGISCDQIDMVVRLKYDDIQWHQSSKKQLVAGTIRQSLASFINPSAIIEHLKAKQIKTNTP